jgi:uncharacterized membrane protein YozB (DUF420 family)
MYRSFIAKNPVMISIVLFIVIFATIIMGQPAFLFNQDGSIRQFGIGYKNKTILPVWLLSIIIGILCYLFVVYYLIYPKLMF